MNDMNLNENKNNGGSNMTDETIEITNSAAAKKAQKKEVPLTEWTSQQKNTKPINTINNSANRVECQEGTSENNHRVTNDMFDDAANKRAYENIRQFKIMNNRSELDYKTRYNKSTGAREIIGVKETLFNAVIILEEWQRYRGAFGLNEIDNKVYTLRPFTTLRDGKKYKALKLVDDDLYNDINVDIASSTMPDYYHANFSSDTLQRAVRVVAQKNKFNPLQSWIEKTKWDGQRRMERLFIDAFAAEDTQFTRNAGKLLMMGLVGRVYHQGCKYDNMTVLYGLQGVRKSTLCQMLTLPDYYCESIKQYTTENKDVTMKLQGAHVVELAELAGLSKTEIETMKAFITETKYDYRKPYGREVETVRAHHVFIGTTNNSGFLKDVTGDRRFTVIRCNKKLDLNVINKEYIEQLYAEALTVWNAAKNKNALLNPDNDEEYPNFSADREEVNKEYTEDNPYVDMADFFINQMPVPDNWYKLNDTDKRFFKGYVYNERNCGKSLEEIARAYDPEKFPATGDFKTLAERGKFQKEDLLNVLFKNEGYKKQSAVKQATEWLCSNGWRRNVTCSFSGVKAKGFKKVE